MHTLRRLALALCAAAIHVCAGLCATFGIGEGCVNLAVGMVGVEALHTCSGSERGACTQGCTLNKVTCESTISA